MGNLSTCWLRRPLIYFLFSTRWLYQFIWFVTFTFLWCWFLGTGCFRLVFCKANITPTSLFHSSIILFCCCCFLENFCFKLASTSPASVELLLSSSSELSSELSSSELSLPDSTRTHDLLLYSLHTITDLIHYQISLMIPGKSKNYCCCFLLLQNYFLLNVKHK